MIILLLKMTEQNTLTAPNDRDKEHRFDFNKPVLTDEETSIAKQDLINKQALTIYPKEERAFCDPTIDDQEYCLVSFIPSVKATPDEKGIYGMVKVRGSYSSLEKCDKRAEFIIKNIDSVHKIYYAGVGKPFPITNSSDFSKDITKVEVQKKIAEDLRQKVDKEKAEIADIKRREKELLEESNSEKTDTQQDPLERYITLRVKKAQLTWTYISTMKKLDEMKKSILLSRKEIIELDGKDDTLKNKYLDRYDESLKKVNISQQKDSFVMYIDEDGKEELGF